MANQIALFRRKIEFFKPNILNSGLSPALPHISALNRSWKFITRLPRVPVRKNAPKIYVLQKDKQTAIEDQKKFVQKFVETCFSFGRCLSKKIFFSPNLKIQRLIVDGKRLNVQNKSLISDGPWRTLHDMGPML